MYPYMYVPNDDFKIFAERIHKNFEKFYQNKICDDAKCRFDKKCSEIGGKENIDLKITLQDFVDTHQYSITQDDMFIDGTDLDDSPNSCYLAVFKSQTQQTDTWYLGNVFMKEYYVVYDHTPKSYYHRTFIQVGIAKQRDQEIFGDVHYSGTGD